MGERAGLYLRISQDRAGEAAGVERQRKDALRLGKSRSFDIIDTFEDNDRSAYSGRRRPEWERLLAAVKSGDVKVVIAWSNDRLYRTAEQQLRLMSAVKDAGGVIVTVKDGEDDPGSAGGRLKMQVLASVAEFESARKAERIEAWHEQRVASGLPNAGGRRPYGYRREGGSFVIQPDEAAVIRRVVRDLLHGRSVSGLVKSLNAEGVPTAQGARWNNQNLKRTVLAPAVAGLRAHKRTATLVQGAWPAIIKPAQRDLLIGLFNDPTRPRRGGGPTTRTRLLSGLLVCGRCGSKMYGDGASGAYTCHNSTGGCGGVRISRQVDDFVWAAALDRLRDLPDDDDAPEVDAIREERLGLEQRRDDFAQRLALGSIDDRAYTVGVAAIDRALEDVDRRIGEVARSARPEIDEAIIGPGVVPGFSSAAALSIPEVAYWHDLIAAVVERILIAPSSRRGVRWEPERVRIEWRDGVVEPTR
jgi:DNA invertase Pin-like site-specific DNA recombinase